MKLIPAFRRWHRWHAVLMSVIVIASAGSGLIHTWMTMMQSPPPPARPGAELALGEVATTPAQVLAALEHPSLAALALRAIDGRPFWQAMPVHGEPLYVDAVTGKADEDADARYAASIARAALGRADVRQSAYLTSYDREYIAIFRLLPVYRFDADDERHTRVYVSTLTGSVARLTDDRKQFEADLFSLAHKWNFLPRPWRDWALVVAMSGLVLLAVSGLVLFGLTRRLTTTRE